MDVDKDVTNMSSIDVLSGSVCLSSYQRIIFALENGCNGDMLEYGPVILNVADLSTLLPPDYSTKGKPIREAGHTNFVPGWLVDKVRETIDCWVYIVFWLLQRILRLKSNKKYYSLNSNNLGYLLIFNALILNFALQIIEAVLWKLRFSNPQIFYADATLCELVRRQASTRRLWLGEIFTGIEKMFIPMNITHNHWTLLV